MFKTLLVANRGEIACRIIHTAKRLGIHTIAVYSEADATSLAVRLADEAYFLGAAFAEQSYLNVSAIIKAAKATGAQAIHPGYGFLSESPELATACQKENICFVGPSVQALQTMGSKQQAKACLSDKAVPLTPGYHGKDQSLLALQNAAKAIGFPILIKAAAGGGGKGMRVVEAEADLKSALEGAMREGKAYFSDATLILEKYLPNARHVEVQLLGDTHGKVFALFDRDCSIQRRHQKIIEEAPAPNLKPKVRQGLSEAACEVAKAIHYVGAGTVEFLVAQSGEFYFMEMNTRLQVEHPVTEAITGLDLVEWQLRIAAGEALPQHFANLKPQGHAIECRIYAEDPEQHFLPSTGTLTFCQTPPAAQARIDTGYESGDTITPHYDPMLSKVITHAPHRDEAIQKMHQALKAYSIAGVKTNMGFLQTLLNHPSFLSAKLNTQFIQTHALLPYHAPPPPLPLAFLLFVAAYDAQVPEDTLMQDCFGFHPFLPQSWEETFNYGGHQVVGKIQANTPSRFVLTYEKRTYTLNITQKSHTPTIAYTFSDGTQTFQGQVYKQGRRWFCFYDALSMCFEKELLEYNKSVQALAHVAPMPGTVVAVLKKQGEAISEEDGILVIEAMKMEHTVRAGEKGVLKNIFYQQGDQVEEGAQLFEVQSSVQHETA